MRGLVVIMTAFIHKIRTSFQVVLNLITPRLWFVMFIFSFLSVVDIISFDIVHGHITMIPALICFAGLKATLFTIFINFSRRKRWLYIAAIAITVILAFLSFINGVSFILYGFGITRGMLYIIVETNNQEIREFVSVMPASIAMRIFSVDALIAAVVVAGLYFVCCKIPGRIFRYVVTVVSIAGLAYIVTYVVTTPFGRSSHFIGLRTASCVKEIILTHAEIQQLRTHSAGLPDEDTAVSSHYAENVILVIGESASRRHHSLYGYILPTTPRLDTISTGLFVFKDALASSVLTSENIPRILTFMDDKPDSEEWYKYPSIIRLMKKFGYHTAWISNQEKTGKWSNLSAILSQDADFVKYVGAISSEDYVLVRYDDEILPEYRKNLSRNDSLRFICVHLMGSHMLFAYRYPSERAKFSADDILSVSPRKWLSRSKAQMIAEYDNSIHYTDSILSELIVSVRDLSQPSILIYLSDHGQTVYDRSDYFGRDELASEVPFLVYTNKAYMLAHPEMIYRLKEALDRPFSTSETIKMILSLTGSRYKLYEASSDPLSASFLPRQRYFDGKKIDRLP